VEAITKGQSEQGLEVIHRSLDAGSDPRQFARQVVDYLRSLLLVAMGNASQVDATPEARNNLARHAQAFTVTELLQVIQAFNQAAAETRSSWQPALPLEMAFVTAITKEEEARPQKSASKAPAPGTASSNPAAVKPAVANKAAGGTSSEQAASRDISSEDASNNQMLEKNWGAILSRIRSQNPNLYGLVNSVKYHVLKGTILSLGLNGDALKAQLEKPANIELLQGVLKQVMGMEIYVQVMLTAGRKSTPPAEVDSDGMVASALRDLGGEIVDIQ
jgi:DNA polymerase-3 subunit gamma/tau